MLKLVIPKGSLEAQTLALFEAADIRLVRGSDRDYHGSVDDPRIDSFSLLRPQEIPRYVEDGFFDLGLTGLDWVLETGAKVDTVAELPYSKAYVGGRVRIVVAVSGASGIEEPHQIKPDSRISTEYMEITRKYFERLGIPVKIFLSYGATEAKVPTIVDAVVEVTDTGSTLRRHGLRIIDTILVSPTLLIANPAAYADPAKRQAIEELKILVLGAINARGKVLMKLNVPEDHLDAVLGHLPSMRAPTVAKLADQSFYAVETVVEKKAVNVLIPQLKALGATDILELPISKIVE
ncbi:MAG TPA: ATP phosphoribosyltransferase [Actinomycetota bacterium]|nr:ATP phosphoribosyltransferase [Actinomycetota bacterium]